MPSVPQQLLARALSRQAAGDCRGAILDYRCVQVLLPSEPSAAVNAVLAWHALQRPDLAAPLCRRAERMAPLLSAVHRVSAENWQALGDVPRTEGALHRALILDPNEAETVNNLGHFLGLGEDSSALIWCRRAVWLAPSQPTPRSNLSAAWLAAGRHAASMAAARTALCLDPSMADGYNNLGNGQFETRRYDEALGSFGRARRLRPDFVAALLNEGGLRLDLGHAGRGAALCRLALILAPDQLGPYNNLANGDLLAVRLPSAAAIFQRALIIAPSDAQTRFNFAAVLLKQGDLPNGWAAYEARRLTLPARRRPQPALPDWPGGDPADARLLLSVEQGYGDALQFCRFAPWLAARGANVTLRTNAPLVALMGSLAGVQRVIALDAPLPTDCDYHLPLMSVPACYRLSLSDLPTRVPYLAAESDQVEIWRQLLQGWPGRKVGLVWSGDPRPDQRSAHLLDQRRSLSLAQFGLLAGQTGITLVSLQKGPAARDTDHPPAGLRLLDWTDRLSDFAATAALISALDLVISVDTAVAHLAGALGRPVWILSRFDGCWRWLDAREDSPWYPTARLFRQAAPNEWSPVMATLQQALADWVRNAF